MAEGGLEISSEELERIQCILKLPLEDAVREKLQTSRELNIVVLGCFQVGKSTLINAMFFREGKAYVVRAEEGSMRSCTDDVKPHTLVVNDGSVSINTNIYDTPGLQDGGNNDMNYLRKIQTKCPKVHLIIYCTKMGEPIRQGEETALENLTSAFGKNVLENFVIALTFANQVEPAAPNEDEVKHFKSTLAAKKQALSDCFKKLRHKQAIVGALENRTYPVGSAKKLKLPTDENWQAEFWRGCLDACQPEGRGALLRLAWRNGNFVKLVVASVGTTGGGVGLIGGIGCVVTGGVLSATGFLAPVGLPLIAAGAVAGILGLGATFSGATGIKAVRKDQED